MLKVFSKIVKGILLFLLICTSVFGKEARDYSRIFIYQSDRLRDKGMAGKINSLTQYVIIFNNVRITGLGIKEVLEYTMYSSGQLLVEVNTARLVLTVERGKDYYIDIEFKDFAVKTKLIDEAAGALFVSKKENYDRILSISEDIRNPIAVITKETFDNAPRSGTGFLLFSDGSIVTNSHVIDKAEKIHVKGIGGDYSTLYEAEVVLEDKNNDLAIIRLKNKTLKLEDPPYPLRPQLAETGEEVFALGYPMTTLLGEEIKLTTGVISSKTGYKGDIASYQISAPVQPGNSEGPLFDAQGNLIGIINAKFAEGEGVSYAIKAAYLKTLLEMSSDSRAVTYENQMKGLALSEIVKNVSPFIYIIETNHD